MNSYLVLLAWPAVLQAQGNPAQITCRIEPASIPVDQPGTLIIEIANVQNLYGYELTMTYDAGRVQIQDADPEKEGINLQLGAFLSPDFVLFNTAENGAIHLTLTQFAPAGPKSGAGELARATLVGTGEGFANVAFGDVTLSDNSGQVIEVATQDCLVEVGAPGQPTPTPTDTPPPTATPTATGVPTNTPTPPPTAAPPTSTFTPQPSAPTSTPAATPDPSATAMPSFTPSVTATETATVVIITTPTPKQVTSTDVAPRTQGQAQSPLATATPTPAQGVSPTATLAPTEIAPEPTAADENPLPSGGAVLTESVAPALGEEALSPPELSVSEESALAGSSQATTVVESTQTPTATSTPFKIARVEPKPPPPLKVIEQPPSSQTFVERHFTRMLGWASLLLTGVLSFAAWRLRKV